MADSHSIVPLINWGFLLKADEQFAEAAQTLKKASLRLQSVPDENIGDEATHRISGPLYPRRFDPFIVAWERAQLDYASDPGAWALCGLDLLRWRVEAALAEISTELNDVDAAVAHARAAVDLRPDSGVTLYALAVALLAAGRNEGAREACELAIKDAPFLMEARRDLIRLDIKAGDNDAALKHCNDWKQLIQGCPHYISWRPTVTSLYTKAAQLARARAARPDALLTFPNWNDTASWQPLVRSFTDAYKPSDRTELLMRVDPADVPDAERVLRDLEAYLGTCLRLKPAAYPNITLLTQATPQEGEACFFEAATALLIATGEQLSPGRRALAERFRLAELLPAHLLQQSAA